MADRSQTSTDLSVYVYGGLHKVLTLPAHVLVGKDKAENVPLSVPIFNAIMNESQINVVSFCKTKSIIVYSV